MCVLNWLQESSSPQGVQVLHLSTSVPIQILSEILREPVNHMDPCCSSLDVHSVGDDVDILIITRAGDLVCTGVSQDPVCCAISALHGNQAAEHT